MTDAFMYANEPSPTISAQWAGLTRAAQLEIVRSSIGSDTTLGSDILEVVDTKANGEVIVRFIEPLGASVRGALLLDIEQYLKDSIEPGLTVWLSPLGDKNSLRNLRGIEVKS